METVNIPQPLGGGPIATETDVLDEPKEQSVSPGRAALRRFLRDTRAVFCLGVILFIIVGSFVFPPFYRHIGPTIKGGVTGATLIGPNLYHDPRHVELTHADEPSSFFPIGPKSLVFPLGADSLGRDNLARLMAGVNVSIIIALAVEVFDIGLGLLFGTLSGFFGGWLDTVLARFTDIMFAFPGLLLIILIGATLGPIFDNFFHPLDRFFPGVGRVALLIAAIGFLVWPLMMRYTRGQTLQLREQQYIEAARTVGSSNGQIIRRHIIPNMMSIVVVAATLNVLGTITTEAGISLLGVGIQPPATSLGLMISDAIGTVYINPIELIIPGLTLVILVVCFAFMGDGINDAFNPRTKD
jgi:ABC-type dipeptide/oligopeptide/nickel transport system permease subunit